MRSSIQVLILEQCQASSAIKNNILDVLHLMVPVSHLFDYPSIPLIVPVLNFPHFSFSMCVCVSKCFVLTGGLIFHFAKKIKVIKKEIP